VEKVLKNGCRYGESAFTFAFLFKLVLDDTGLKPSVIAHELNRERSLMYKWLSGKSTPPVSYFPDIVSIVSTHTSEARKRILENKLRSLIGRISLCRDVRTTVLSADSFDDFLSECLHLSVMDGIALETQGDGAGELRWQTLVFSGALFAALFGGVLWNLLNRLFRWPYFMGSIEESLRGTHALLWAVVTTAPVPLPLLLLSRPAKRRGLIVSVTLFIVIGSLSAFAFFSLGIREVIESAGWSYRMQESIIGVLFSLMLSLPPLLAASLIFSRGRLAWGHVLLLFLPAFTVFLTLCITFLIDRPAAEITQLRGFAVAFVLRLTLFFSLLWAYRLSANTGMR